MSKGAAQFWSWLWLFGAVVCLVVHEPLFCFLSMAIAFVCRCTFGILAALEHEPSTTLTNGEA